MQKKHILSFISALLIFNLLSCDKKKKIHEAFTDIKKVSPTIIVEMRYAGEHNFIGEGIKGYYAPKCILTKKAAIALSNIQRELKRFNLSLKIYDCYRPQRAVDHFVKWAEDLEDIKMKREFYPKIEKANLFKDGYIASKSGHSRGSTVDLTIVSLPVSAQEEYKEEQELKECYLSLDKRFKDNSIDMGTGFDCFSELSHTENLSIGLDQRKNRLLLRLIMEKYGFENYSKEWWHYTLKDEPFPDTYFDFAIE